MMNKKILAFFGLIIVVCLAAGLWLWQSSTLLTDLTSLTKNNSTPAPVDQQKTAEQKTAEEKKLVEETRVLTPVEIKDNEQKLPEIVKSANLSDCDKLQIRYTDVCRNNIIMNKVAVTGNKILCDQVTGDASKANCAEVAQKSQNNNTVNNIINNVNQPAGQTVDITKKTPAEVIRDKEILIKEKEDQIAQIDKEIEDNKVTTTPAQKDELTKQKEELIKEKEVLVKEKDSLAKQQYDLFVQTVKDGSAYKNLMEAYEANKMTEYKFGEYIKQVAYLNQPTLCWEIPEDLRQKCLYGVYVIQARQKDDTKVCDNMVTPAWKEFCLFEVLKQRAVIKQDPSICAAPLNSQDIEKCKKEVSAS